MLAFCIMSGIFRRLKDVPNFEDIFLELNNIHQGFYSIITVIKRLHFSVGVYSF